MYKNKLKLNLNLNYFNFPLFKEGDCGTIHFINVKAFKIGDLNDEGFFLNDHPIWNKSNFPEGIYWNSFYEVKNTPEDYFNSFYRVSYLPNNKDFHHYVFFMKEGTFECLAESFEEKIKL